MSHLKKCLVRSALTTSREASLAARRNEPAANLQVCLSFSDKRFVKIRRLKILAEFLSAELYDHH
jgi:hypothetical protein